MKSEIMTHGSAILREKTLPLLKDTSNIIRISPKIQQSIRIFECNKNFPNLNHP
jgi:hypothetical protein